MSVLTLSGIGKKFGKTVALDDISLDVATGEFICLLGASGCGKTTLLRIVAGLESHDKGDIHLDGKALSGVPCHKRNIGMVFQSLALFPHLNVGDNIAYGLKMRGTTKEAVSARVTELLEMVGLADFDSRPVDSLSGGQKQRVAIARALALEPQLFLMDEPFSALDAGLREHLQQEVRKIQKQLAVTTLFVTHDQSEAMAMADRIVILNKGKIEQAGTPEEVYKNPGTRFVAEFIGSNNLLDVNITADSIRFNDSNLGSPQHLTSTLQGKSTLAIRPEAIALRTENLEESYLQGTVVMQRPVGALIEHEIDVAGAVIKQTGFQTVTPKLAPGEAVGLTWDWSHVWQLPAEA